MNEMIHTLMSNETVVACMAISVTGMVCPIVMYNLMARSLMGYRRRGNRDAKTGAARPYENGWTSPLVHQIVETFDNKLACLTHKAEKKQGRLYEKVSAEISEVEKLESYKTNLEERHANPALPYKDMSPEMISRKEAHYFQQRDHIANMQSEHVKVMAKLRTKINTNRQKYLEKKEAIQNKRDERINAYWNGVAQRMGDAPVIPEYEQDNSAAHATYLERNNHVLEQIDYYIENYLQPEDVSNLEV